MKEILLGLFFLFILFVTVRIGWAFYDMACAPLDDFEDY